MVVLEITAVVDAYNGSADGVVCLWSLVFLRGSLRGIAWVLLDHR